MFICGVVWFHCLKKAQSLREIQRASTLEREREDEGVTEFE